VEITIPFAAKDKSFETTITRDELEKLARPIVEKTRRHCLHALSDAELTPADLDAVILVGGSTRMPLVRRFVQQIFEREPNTSQNPDEAVAMGAAIQGGILSGAVRDVLLLDVTPLSLGIETFGGLMNIIIPRNSTIPCKAGELFTNAVGGQQSMLVRILQGERELAKDNWELGKVNIPFKPAPKGQARVGVQFEIDADGILEVLVRDTQTGQEKTLEIQSAVDVSDEAVEQMIEESVEHAFEDMNERVWTETRMKSEELLPSVETALAMAGDDLPEEERRQIQDLTATLRNALEGDDVQEVRRLNKELDEATQNLATLLMEKAFDALDES
jgi:molecular chaperone DnaK